MTTAAQAADAGPLSLERQGEPVHTARRHVGEARLLQVGAHLLGVGALAAVVELGRELLLDLVEGGRCLREELVHQHLRSGKYPAPSRRDQCAHRMRMKKQALWYQIL